VGEVGTPTTLNSGDVAGVLMLAVQALEKQNAAQQARIERLEQLVEQRLGVEVSQTRPATEAVAAKR
jgi:hypothetical protein